MLLRDSPEVAKRHRVFQQPSRETVLRGKRWRNQASMALRPTPCRVGLFYTNACFTV